MEENRIAYKTSDSDEGLLVLVPDDLNDELDTKIEEFYDGMLDLDREIYESTLDTTANNYQAAGITVDLNDGRVVYAKVDAMLLGKVLQCITPEELSDIVNAVASAVEAPDERSPCQRVRDGEF